MVRYRHNLAYNPSGGEGKGWPESERLSLRIRLLCPKGTSTEFTLLVPLIILTRADFFSHYSVEVWISIPFKDAIESFAGD